MKHFLILFVFGISAAFAQVPGQMNYQGQLLQDNGTPASGTVDIQIQIFGSMSGGSSLRNETFSGVTLADEGLFSVALGSSGTPLTEVFDGSGDRFIQVRQRSPGGTFAAVGPRQQILSVPFANVASSLGQVSSIRVSNASGQVEGSNNYRIATFADIQHQFGDAIAYDATAGTFTVSRTGIYWIVYRGLSPAGVHTHELARNSDGNPFDRLCAVSGSATCTWTGLLCEGDVIRPLFTDSSPDNGDVWRFEMTTWGSVAMDCPRTDN